MKNKRFTIFRRFTTHAAKANFWGFWALKGPIFIILTPILFYMLYNVILDLSMKFGGCKCKNKDFMAQKPHFSEKIAIFRKLHFSKPKISGTNFFPTIFVLALRNLANC